LVWKCELLGYVALEPFVFNMMLVSGCIKCGTASSGIKPGETRCKPNGYRKVLNQAETSQDQSVTAIYDQHSYLDEKREALEKWGESLREIVSV